MRKAPALATELALAHIRQQLFSDGSLADFYLSHPSVRVANEGRILRKLEADRERFERCANAEQRHQIEKLWRFHQAAKYGPALSTSWKRTRHAIFFDFLSRLPSWLEPPPGFPPPDLPKIAKALTAVLKAVQREDAWPNFVIASNFKRRRFLEHRFFAEYSWLMLGKPPALTLGELQKILHWINRYDLQSRITKLRRKYGELAVPLKRGQPGRPRTK